MFKACIGLNCARHVDFLDRRHGSLTHIPDEVYRNEEHLEELLLDMNGLQDLPPKFFRLTNLRKLSVSENELLRLSPHISNLTHLVELDVSKNALDEIPESIRFCRSLSILEISSNPLLKVPECLTNIKSLTVLMMNDCSLPRLPTEIGSLENLVVLEARENLLKSVPRSVAQLKKLQRLDLGNNEIEELPPQIGSLESLEELQLDSNQLKELPDDIGRLSTLLSIDVTKNKLEFLPVTINHLCNLKDLHASENLLTTVPASIGEMNHLLTLKLDMNRLLDLPDTLGGLTSLTELFLFENMIDNLPATLFDMPAVQMLDLSRNHIIELPQAIGHCTSLRVLSLRDNELTVVPDEVGLLKDLQVLDLSGNRLLHLPMSFRKLELDALWLSDLQRQPLIPLHPEPDPENSEHMILTCSALPQKSTEEHSLMSSEGEEHHRSRDDLDKKVVAFDPNIIGARSDSFRNPRLVRFPTPRRQDRHDRSGDGKKKGRKSKHKPHLEMPVGAPIFKKRKADEVITDDGDDESITDAKLVATGEVEDVQDDLGRGDWKRQHVLRKKAPEVISPPPNEKKGGTVDLCDSVQKRGPADVTPDLLQNTSRAVIASSTSPPTGPSTLQTVEVTIELQRIPGKSLGFSIAGGRGSTPAYEDVDDSIFITKVAPGGVAEADGRLRLGDKLLSVNGQNMAGASHQESVNALKAVTASCLLVVSREVLVVMPSSTATPSPTPAVVTGVQKPEKGAEQSASQDLREFGMKIAASHQEKPTVCVADPSPTPAKKQEAETTSPGTTVTPEKQAAEGDDEVTKQMQSLVTEISDREKQGFVAMEPDKEDVPVDEKEAESKDRSKRSSDYANFNIAQLIQSAAKQEGEGSEKAESPDPDPSSIEQLSSVPVDLTDSESSSDSDSDSDVVVLRPNMTKEQSPYPEELVVLKRGTGLLGLKIVGGADHVCKPFGDGEPGIFVSRVTPGGAAAASGKLKVGDRILQVNETDVRNARHETAVSLLIERRDTITLLVRHVPPPPGLEEITLVKGLHDKLGLSIRGGMKTDYTDEGGIYISKVIPGGAAAKDGRLKVGQRILEVNAQSLLGASHMDAVRALRGVQEKMTVLVCDGFKPEDLESTMPVSKKNSSMNNSTEILAIEETEKQVKSMISELGTMEDNTGDGKLDKAEGEKEGAEEGAPIVRSPSGTFELPPEASSQITTLHKEMEEMKESVEKEASERVEQIEEQKQRRSVEDVRQLKEIEELERQAEQAEERSKTLRDEVRRKSEAADKKVRDFASELEEQRKKDHEERLDRAARSVSEDMEPEFLSSVMDEMSGLTSVINEEIEKSCSDTSVAKEEEVAMVTPEVAEVTPDVSLESVPVINGDGEPAEHSPEEPLEEHLEEKPSVPEVDSEVVVNTTQQSTEKKEETTKEKWTMMEDEDEDGDDSSEDAVSFHDRLKFHEQAIKESITRAKRAPPPLSSKTKTPFPNVETIPPCTLTEDEIRERVDNRPLGSIKERMAAFQSNSAGVGVSSAVGDKSSEVRR